jgi:hypothetical protein
MSGKLGDVLAAVDSLPIGGHLYVKGVYPWNSATSAWILEVEDEEFGQDMETEFSKQQGLKYVFPVVDLFQIVGYAEQQVSKPTVNQLVESLNYYYKHDAFLELSKIDET